MNIDYIYNLWYILIFIGTSCAAITCPIGQGCVAGVGCQTTTCETVDCHPGDTCIDDPVEGAQCVAS